MNTPSSREADRIALAAQVAAFAGSIEMLPSFPERPTYARRTAWIDPTTVPKRQKQKPRISPEAQAKKTEAKQAARRRGRELLRKEWPDLNVQALTRERGVHITVMYKRISHGMTLDQALGA